MLWLVFCMWLVCICDCDGCAVSAFICLLVSCLYIVWIFFWFTFFHVVCFHIFGGDASSKRREVKERK